VIGDLSVRDFSAQLASRAPTPGGGSAAALAGALGAGLVSMVCNFTVGREKYAEVEDEMQALLRRSEELRGELEQAVEDDVAAYGSYADAQKLPRESEEQQRERDSALAGAMRSSTVVPLEVAERCAELLGLAVRAAELGNRFLISDAAVGAELAAAARASAAFARASARRNRSASTGCRRWMRNWRWKRRGPSPWACPCWRGRAPRCCSRPGR
jgi:formiminotetrahydrofolate cyclodeaminase